MAMAENDRDCVFESLVGRVLLMGLGDTIEVRVHGGRDEAGGDSRNAWCAQNNQRTNFERVQIRQRLHPELPG